MGISTISNYSSLPANLSDGISDVCFLYCSATFPAAHTAKLGQAGEIRLVETLASYLQRKTSVLSTASSVESVRNVFAKYAQIGMIAPQASTSSSSSSSAPASTSASSSSSSSTPSVAQTPKKSTSAPAHTSSTPSPSSTKSQKKSEKEAKDDDAEEADDNSESEGLQRPNAGNGGSGPGYEWTQTLQEVVATFPLSPSVKSKSIQVDCEDDSLKITVEGREIISGSFFESVNSASHTWTLDTVKDGKMLTLYLKKANTMSWWDSLVKGHPQVNTKLIQPENSKLDDLDAETRTMVTKMMVCCVLLRYATMMMMLFDCFVALLPCLSPSSC